MMEIMIIESSLVMECVEAQALSVNRYGMI